MIQVEEVMLKGLNKHSVASTKTTDKRRNKYKVWTMYRRTGSRCSVVPSESSLMGEEAGWVDECEAGTVDGQRKWKGRSELLRGRGE